MKKYLWGMMAILAAFCLIFASCGSEEDSGPGGDATTGLMHSWPLQPAMDLPVEEFADSETPRYQSRDVAGDLNINWCGPAVQWPQDSDWGRSVYGLSTEHLGDQNYNWALLVGIHSDGGQVWPDKPGYQGEEAIKDPPDQLTTTFWIKGTLSKDYHVEETDAFYTQQMLSLQAHRDWAAFDYVFKAEDGVLWIGTHMFGDELENDFPDLKKYDDKWTHIALTFDGVDVGLYINGEFIRNAETNSDIPLPNLNQILIGGNFANSFFIGRMADVRLYSRVLSQKDIQTVRWQAPKKVRG